jgi:mRNA deadenylase 3'-5' endonuclease subunit Ccr4
MIEAIIGVSISIVTYKFINELFSIFSEGERDLYYCSMDSSEENLGFNLEDLVFDQDAEMQDEDPVNEIGEFESLPENNNKINNVEALNEEGQQIDTETEDIWSCPHELNDLIMFHSRAIEEEGTNSNTLLLESKLDKKSPTSEVFDFRNVRWEIKERKIDFGDNSNHSNSSKSSLVTSLIGLTANTNEGNLQIKESKFLSKKRRNEGTPDKENIDSNRVRMRMKIKKIRKNSLTFNAPYIDSFISIPNAPSSNIPDDFKISIVTYNILNQIYMKKSNRQDLSIEGRMKKIIEELQKLNADIICLQEADLPTYRNYIVNSFPEHNFIYGVNCGSSFINIIGFKRQKYRFVSFKNFSLLDIKVNGNRGAMNVVLERACDRDLVSVYNVHLPWRHETQRCQILERIFSHVIETKVNKVLLSGDFNSEPYSLPVKLVLFNKFMHDLQNSNTENFNYAFTEMVTYSQLLTFEHVKDAFHFQSAYDDYKTFAKKKSTSSHNQLSFSNSKNCRAHTHPNITSCTEYFKNTIDYIFHSKSFELLRILRLPESKEIFEEGFLPSSKFPSDHLKLYAEYKLL